MGCNNKHNVYEAFLAGELFADALLSNGCCHKKCHCPCNGYGDDLLLLNEMAELRNGRCHPYRYGHCGDIY